MDETQVAEAPQAETQTEPKAKRKYVKVSTGELIKIANRLGDVYAVAHATGMSINGVKGRLKRMKDGGVGLKKSLFEKRKRSAGK